MYDLHSPFDLQKHMETYINYLEVVIFPDGHIEYAVPSHPEKLIKVCMDKLGVSRYQLEQMCPREYHFDYMTWLCNISECVSVWNTYVVASDKIPLTINQRKTLYTLANKGIFRPNISINCIGVNPVGYNFETKEWEN